MTTSRLLTDIPGLWRGALDSPLDPYAQNAALEASWRLALVLAVAIAAERIVAFAIRRPLSALEFARSNSPRETAAAGWGRIHGRGYRRLVVRDADHR